MFVGRTRNGGAAGLLPYCLKSVGASKNFSSVAALNSNGPSAGQVFF
jgi:hypothetical protein